MPHYPYSTTAAESGTAGIAETADATLPAVKVAEVATVAAIVLAAVAAVFIAAAVAAVSACPARMKDSTSPMGRPAGTVAAVLVRGQQRPTNSTALSRHTSHQRPNKAMAARRTAM